MHALAHGRFDEAQRLRRERELVPWHSVSGEHHLQLGLLRESVLDELELEAGQLLRAGQRDSLKLMLRGRARRIQRC